MEVATVPTEQEMQEVYMLVEVEETIGQLYTLYAERFSTDGDFWRKLAREEDIHARWVRFLCDAVTEGKAGFSVENFAPATYQTFLGYLQRSVANAKDGTLTAFDAFSVALDIESTFIEKDFFTVFFAETAEIRSLLDALNTSTAKHMQRVQEAWKAHRPAVVRRAKPTA